MESLIKQTWPYIRISTILAATLIVVINFIDNAGLNLIGYLLVSWLLLPIVTFWVLGDHDLPISFMIRVYPKSLRKFTAYGAVFMVSLASMYFVLLIVFTSNS